MSVQPTVMDVFAFAALEVEDDVTVLLGSARQPHRARIVATYRSDPTVPPGSVRVSVFGGLVVARERVLAGDAADCREPFATGPEGSSPVPASTPAGSR
jgi:hypothetical protein